MGGRIYDLEAVNGKEPCNGDDATKKNKGEEYVLASSKHVTVRLSRALRLCLALSRWLAQRKDEATENDVAEKCEARDQNITEARSTFDLVCREPSIEPRHDEPQTPEDWPANLAKVTRRLIWGGVTHGTQRLI